MITTYTDKYENRSFNLFCLTCAHCCHHNTAVREIYRKTFSLSIGSIIRDRLLWWPLRIPIRWNHTYPWRNQLPTYQQSGSRSFFTWLVSVGGKPRQSTFDTEADTTTSSIGKRNRWKQQSWTSEPGKDHNHGFRRGNRQTPFKQCIQFFDWSCGKLYAKRSWWFFTKKADGSLLKKLMALY